MKFALPGIVFATVLSAFTAFAGPVVEFESAYRHMYGNYRTALFVTNAGRQEAAVQAMTGLNESFFALRDAYGTMPPPHFEDDPHWAETMDEVAGLLEQAAAEVGAGDLADAHETLEGVRDRFSALHLRNGVTSFSDRMNAYHAEMEHVLSMDLATADVGAVREKAAVLDYLARDIRNNPPVEALSGGAEFDKLVTGFAASVSALLDAARSGDMDKVKAAVGGLKKPYSMLFLKFG